jgi:hypothetical protein
MNELKRPAIEYEVVGSMQGVLMDCVVQTKQNESLLSHSSTLGWKHED